MLAFALATADAAAIRGGSSGLATSAAMTTTGPGISCVLGADGRYTITTDASCTTLSHVTTGDDVFPGDYLAEIEIITHANQAWAGFDNAAYVNGSVTSIDEAFFPDQGLGAGKANYMKNSVNTVTNVAWTNRIYMERVGTIVKFYQGLTWPAALLAGAIITSTAVDGTARSFTFGVNAAGIVAQWKVRAIVHP